jgi:hypothetical protein
MADQDKQNCERWVIIPLTVKGREVVQIEHRLPANVFHCTGVTISVSGLSGYYISTKLGELSLSFNNRAVQPVNLPANWIPYRKRLDDILFRLEQPLVGGTRVSGYFQNIVPFDYNVQIYLQCVASI